MSNGNKTITQCQTYVIGAGYLVKRLMEELDVVGTIDRALKHQPRVGVSYGQLAQVIILNRLAFSPQPLYHLEKWVRDHGIDRWLGLEAEWLDDDRVGALLEGVANHQAEIWLAIVGRAVERFGVVREWLQSDTTSVYFEGSYEDENGAPRAEANGPLLVRGYNKDGKRQKVQFVLSLITTQRVPLWYRVWNGNQSDKGVYLADMQRLRAAGWIPNNVILIGDRKLCDRETLLTMVRTGQLFLAAHPWTETTKNLWRATWKQLERGERQWQDVPYVPRYQAQWAPEKQTKYRVCEVVYPLSDPQTGQTYALRGFFTWSSNKAKRDAQHRQQALAAGEQALQRLARLVGKYDYTNRHTILSRVEKALRQAEAQAYFRITLLGPEEHQSWSLTWERCDDVIADAASFDGIAFLCSNIPSERLPAEASIVKYKGQIGVEQTIDFIKSPVQIRPMWLHSPKRLAGLTLLIMLAVLMAALLEYHIRRYLAHTQQPLQGLMPEHRDNLYPSARMLLQAFHDVVLVVLRWSDGQEELHFSQLRPVQRQILDILKTLDPG